MAAVDLRAMTPTRFDMEKDESGLGKSKTAVYTALIGNVLVAVTKFAAALWTGSSAMMSEAVVIAIETEVRAKHPSVAAVFIKPQTHARYRAIRRARFGSS